MDKRPKKNLRRTKDEPKNSELQKVRFIKIAVSFPSLIPCPIPPRDERENTERRAKRYRALAAKNSALFLRLLPKKVDSSPKKVDSLPKKVCLLRLLSLFITPESYSGTYRLQTEKCAPKCIFLAHLKKILYLCSAKVELLKSYVSIHTK